MCLGQGNLAQTHPERGKYNAYFTQNTYKVMKERRKRPGGEADGASNRERKKNTGKNLQILRK